MKNMPATAMRMDQRIDKYHGESFKSVSATPMAMAIKIFKHTVIICYSSFF
jgi:hypothetical protein